MTILNCLWATDTDDIPQKAPVSAKKNPEDDIIANFIDIDPNQKTYTTIDIFVSEEKK